MFGENSHRKIPSSRSRPFPRLGIFDIAWASICPLLAFLIRDGVIYRIDIVAIYSCMALCSSLVCFQWFRISEPISIYLSAHDASKIVQACLATVSLTAVLLFTFTRLEDAPRSIPVLHFFILASGLFAVRIVPRFLTRGDFNNQHLDVQAKLENVLIIGASKLGSFFSKMVEEFASNNVRILAILDERPWLFNRSLNGSFIIGPPSHLGKIIEEYDVHGVTIHKVVIAMQSEETTGASWDEIRRICDEKNVKIEWLYERFAFLSSQVAKQSQLSERVGNRVAIGSGWSYWKLKRVMDIILSLLIMIIISPLAIAVAGLVFIDVGLPIVFWQQRLGRYGRHLHMYKFRTMKAAFDCDGHPVETSKRLSKLGQFTRKNRLDEIPQLFNILTGDMSFIGPRPLLPVDQPKSANFRLQVRPGLTGLAQVNGATLLSPNEKSALDEWYIRHASLLLDIKILFRTVWVILRGEQRNETSIVAALSEQPRGKQQHFHLR